MGVSPYNSLTGAQAGLAAAASAVDYLPCYSIFSATLPAGLASLNTTLTFKLLPQTARLPLFPSLRTQRAGLRCV